MSFDLCAASAWTTTGSWCGARTRSPSGLAGGDRGHGDRVLAAVGAGLRRLARAGWTTWFVGGKVNVARVCVHDWARRTPDAVAAVLSGENGDGASGRTRSSRGGDALRGGALSLGVEPGDCVGCSCRWRRRWQSSHACAHIGADQLPSSPASPLRPSRSASRTPRRRCFSPRPLVSARPRDADARDRRRSRRGGPLGGGCR